jgi:hypothetical protein
MCTAAWLIVGAVKNIICSLMAHLPQWARTPHYRDFMITLRHTTFITTPLGERSERHRDLYLACTQHSQDSNIHKTGGIQTRKPGQASGCRPTPYTTTRPLVSVGKEHDYKHSMIYLLNAIGLPPGGSSTVHIYTQTKHRTIQNKQYIEQHKHFGRVRNVPRLCWLYPGICLTTDEKARKNLSQGSDT